LSSSPPDRPAGRARARLAWCLLAAAILLPTLLAATSPLLAWRGPIYILACFAGIAALALVLLQPLLAGGYLPGLPGPRGRRAHLPVGAALVAAVLLHVAGLWHTSPPDMLDALLLRSPTSRPRRRGRRRWAILAVALLAAFRRRLRLRPRTWRRAHMLLALVIVAGGLVHAMLIEGVMEPVSKAVLCALALAATAKALFDLRPWRARPAPALPSAGRADRNIQ